VGGTGEREKNRPLDSPLVARRDGDRWERRDPAVSQALRPDSGGFIARRDDGSGDPGTLSLVVIFRVSRAWTPMFVEVGPATTQPTTQRPPQAGGLFVFQKASTVPRGRGASFRPGTPVFFRLGFPFRGRGRQPCSCAGDSAGRPG